MNIDRIHLPLYNNIKFKAPNMKSVWYLKRRSKKCLPNVKDKTVLEIGSNSGYDTFLIASRGAKKVIALENNNELFVLSNGIKEKEEIKNVEFILRSWKDYIIETNNHFDIILSFSSIPIEELSQYIQTILEKCDKFIWTHNNTATIDNNDIIEKWNVLDINKILNKYPHTIIRKKTNNLKKFTSLDYWVEFRKE